MRDMLIILFCWLLLIGCNSTNEHQCAFQPDTSAIKVDLSFVSLEDSLPTIKSKKELIGFFGRHASLRDFFFNRPAYPTDTSFINSLYQKFTNPHLDTLQMETHRVFGNSTELKSEFEKAFINVTYYYPEFQIPKIQTTITGLEGGSDLYVSDSLIIIGLDYFLGDSAKYQSHDMPHYMLRRYTKHFIVPSVMLLTGIDSRINKVNAEDRTVLADMIAYGKAYYFTKQMLPCIPDSVLIGYTKKEIEGSRKFENLIWSRFVEDQVLFATSHVVKQKYISERPKTIEVGEECPGRIGTWIGWQIVNRYMQTHSEVSLQQLMNMKNASQLFNDSGYKPQVVKVPGKEKI